MSYTNSIIVVVLVSIHLFAVSVSRVGGVWVVVYTYILNGKQLLCKHSKFYSSSLTSTRLYVELHYNKSHFKFISSYSTSIGNLEDIPESRM